MTRPAARVLTLLELLQSGGLRTVGELADRLGVDPRTVRRYVGHLLDLDIPVETVRGRAGGYRLARGFRMPPLMLDEEEALAVVLGLVTAERTLPVETAVAKVRRVLPARLAARLDAVLGTLSFTGPSSGGASAHPDGSVLLPLADAVRHHRPVSIRYRDRQGRRTDRVLHPYGVVVHSGRWYVTGRDPAAEAGRTFRLDRIADVRVLPGAFEPPAGLDVAGHVLAGFAAADYRFVAVIHVDGPAERIRARLPESVAMITEDAGRCRVELHAERLDWIPAVLASLDLPFVIEGPAELRALTIAFAERLTASAAG